MSWNGSELTETNNKINPENVAIVSGTRIDNIVKKAMQKIFLNTVQKTSPENILL